MSVDSVLHQYQFPGFNNYTVAIQCINTEGSWVTSIQGLSVLFFAMFVRLTFIQNKSLDKNHAASPPQTLLWLPGSLGLNN